MTRPDIPEGGALLVAGAAGAERQPPQRAGGSPGWHQPLHVRDRATARRLLEAQVASGADVILAPAYLTHRRALSAFGETRRAPEWTRDAVAVAHEAVEQGIERRLASATPDSAATGTARADRGVLVAGPLAPLAPGRFEGSLDPGLIAEEDRERAGLLAEAGADLLFAEAMPSLMEARSAASAATETGLPSWLGLRVAPSGAHLPSGDPIEAVWQEVAELPLAGLLLSPPDRGAAAMVLEAVSRLASVPLGAWLDGLAGGPTDGAAADDLGADADRWFEAGATLVGIASGATPAALTRLRAVIDRRAAAADERRAADHAAWIETVGRGAARAPGGRALWLGSSPPASMPPGFAWSFANGAESRALPDGAFRFVVADGDEASVVDDLARVLDADGGHLLVRATEPLTRIPDDLEVISAGATPGGDVTLLRRRR